MKLENLETNFLGRNVVYYKTIDSTQLETWRMAGNDGKSGTVIVADMQTKGKRNSWKNLVHRRE